MSAAAGRYFKNIIPKVEKQKKKRINYWHVRGAAPKIELPRPSPFEAARVGGKPSA